METLKQGRDRQCKDTLGGVSHVYLFPYVKYNRSQIVRNEFELISFPATNVYKYEILRGSQLDNNIQEDEGGKYYEQNISLRLNGIEANPEFKLSLYTDFRIIVKDNNGLYRLMGAYLGLECNKLSQLTGSSKTDFNGYQLDFNGKEEVDSLFFTNLNSVGFTEII